MKVRWLGESDPLYFINGKVYDARPCSWGENYLNVVDETGEEYAYLAEEFEVVSGSDAEFVDPFYEKCEDERNAG